MQRRTERGEIMNSFDSLKDKIRNIPDFPKRGIVFRDITTLLKDGDAFRIAIDKMAEYCRKKSPDIIVSSEARGFIFGGAIAYKLGIGFVPVRKPGKLPHKTINQSYEKEYGPDILEIHSDAVVKGQKVVIVDDLLATAGTALGTLELVEKLGGDVIGLCFLIELSFLDGKKKLDSYDVFSLMQYDSE